MQKTVALSLLAAILPICAQSARFAPKAVSERRCLINENAKQDIYADGKAMFEIVTPPTATPTVKFAAAELAQHLGKVLNCELEVLNRKSGELPALIVGDLELARANGMNPAELDRDGFFIRSLGRDVLMVGVDAPGKMIEHSEKGSLFAVYDFLERFAGVRFYFPGEIGTVAPPLQSWALPQIDIMERPDFQYRRIYAVNLPRISKSKERITWYDDCLEPMEQYRLANIRYRMMTRNIPNCHGLVGLGLKDRFAKSKPEFFALDTRGKRMDGSDYSHPNDAAGQICFSNKELQEEIFLDAKAILTRQPPGSRNAFLADGKPAWSWNHHTPGEFFCVMPNDSCYLCRCPECWKHFSGSSSGHYTQETTDYIWRFMAGVAERLKAEGIPGYVTTMAYSQYQGIPSFGLPDNMIIMLALTGPWNEGKTMQKEDDELLRAWTEKLGGKIYLWTYPSKYWVAIPGIPNMAPQSVGSYFQRREPEIFGAFIESETDLWIFAYLNYYLFGRVMWDKNTDIQAVFDEHHRLMFGAAAPEMAEFYSVLEDHWINELCGAEISTPAGPAKVVPPADVIWNQVYSPAECQRITQLLVAAEKKVKNDQQSLQRLKFIGEKLWQPVLDAAEAYHRMVQDNRDWKVHIPKLAPDDAITIDGRGEEEIWRKMEPFYLLPKNDNDSETVQVHTLCRAAFDEQSLYFLIECREPQTAKMMSHPRAQDDVEIWKDNSVELFLALPGEDGCGYQFMFNSSGSASSNQFRPAWMDWKWDAGIEYKTHIDESQGWSLEVRIPRSEVGLATAESIAANITRHRVLQDEKSSYDIWSPFVTGSNHQTANYGHLQLHPPTETNLIENSDFREPIHNRRFIGKWFTGKTMQTDDKVFRTAGVSVWIDPENPSLGQYLPMIKPNTRYRLSYYIKTENVKLLTSQNTGVYVRFNLANGKPFLFPSGTGYLGSIPWIRQSFEFTTPDQINTKENDRVYIRFTMHPQWTDGKAWVDKVELYEIK